MTEEAPTAASRSPLIAPAVVLVLLLIAGWLLSERGKTVSVAANDWPWWRGLQHQNIANGDAPTKWSTDQNIRWRAKVSGRGHGTPIVIGSKVIVASANDLTQTLSLHAYDRSNGSSIWSVDLTSGAAMHKSIKNTYASSSPASDGKAVYYPWIADEQLWLASVSIEGDVNWKKSIATFFSEHGYASSPCIHQSLVIVPSDNLGASYLTGIDRSSGEIVWQVPRRTGGSYTSPVIHQFGNQPQLIMSGQGQVVSYNPSTGDTLWTCEGPGLSTIGTASFDDELVFVTCGAPPMIAGVMAIDALTGKIAWQADAMANVPSSLVVDNQLLVTEDRGTLVCFDTKTGEKKWRERLGGNLSASPTATENAIYLPDESGTVSVFRLGDTLELIAENDLGDGGFASPVITGGQLFLRTERALFCIEQQ
jgi:outer membrane protein assembly factor BamB